MAPSPPPPEPPTPLVERLARQIKAHLHGDAVPVGTRLPERALAEQLRVSRSPVRAAMQLLAEEGVLGRRAEGGFAVRRRPRRAPPPTPDSNEAVFLRLAELHLSGGLPPRVSERALAQRLGAPRAAMLRALARAAEEGWAERLPGRGWSLLPVLSTREALAESYRLRMLLEPAGLLDPAFRADHDALHALRREIVATMVDAGATPAAIYALGLRFHTLLIRQSRNALLIDAVTRINSARRVVGYRRNLDRARLLARCEEHVALLDLVLAGQLRLAARRLRRHIAADMRDKLGQDDGRSA